MSASRENRPPTRQRAKPARRRHGHRVHPLVIALTVILAAAFVTFYAFNQGLPFGHAFTVHAYVGDSVNVRAGDPVRIAGINVGAVTATSPAGRATEIDFSVSQNGQPIHADATIAIRDRLFLEGSYYLDLDPGTPSAPVMHDGGTIPESQTSSPVQFYKVLSTFDVATRGNLTDLVLTFDKSFDAQSGKPVQDSGAGELKAAIPSFAPALKDTAIVTRALTGTQPGDVQRLLSSSADVAGTLAANRDALASLVSRLNTTAQALVASDGALAASVSGLDATLRVAPPALSAVDHALPPLVNLGAALEPSLRVAPPILDSLTRTVRQLAAVVAPAERAQLLTTLRATFQQFPSILTLLAKTFPITKQVTDCLRTHLLPVFKEQVPDGALSSGESVWQDFVHFLPGLAGASGGFDANGPYTRVLAAAGTNSLSGTGGLGSLPIIGQLVGTGAPGGSAVIGSRPTWLGDLPPSSFRPDVPCATQKVPSLAANTVASDLRAAHSSAVPPMSRAQFDAAIARNRPAAASGRSR